MVPKITTVPATRSADPPIQAEDGQGARDEPGLPHQPDEDPPLADANHLTRAKAEDPVMQRDQRPAGDHQHPFVSAACVRARRIRRQDRHDAKGDEHALGQPRR